MVSGMKVTMAMMSTLVNKPVPTQMISSGMKTTCGVALYADRNGSTA